MTDIEPYREPQSALMKFAQEARDVHNIAQALAKTSFVPAAMQGKPEEVTGAILAGMELGLSPMNALRSIDIIQGRPSLTANAQRGLLQSRGVVFELAESTATRCIMRATRDGVTTSVTWTIDRAQQAGLANKDQWRKMPQSMLVARATSELCRLVGADILHGFGYSKEELEDGTDTPSAPATEAAPPTKRTAQRRPVQASVHPQPEPEFDRGGYQVPANNTHNTGWEDIEVRQIASGPEPELPLDGDAKIEDDTRKAIMAGFNDLGIRDRVPRLAKISDILDREVPSVNVLSEAEGRKVVAWLQEARQDQPA